VFFSISGVMLSRQSATIRAASSANAVSRVGRPTISTSRATVALGSPTMPAVFG
jgi:hypothetical protein